MPDSCQMRYFGHYNNLIVIPDIHEGLALELWFSRVTITTSPGDIPVDILRATLPKPVEDGKAKPEVFLLTTLVVDHAASPVPSAPARPTTL